MGCGHSLRRHGRSDGISCARERNQERVPLRVDLTAIFRCERGTQQALVLCEHVRVTTITEALQEFCQARDVRKQEASPFRSAQASDVRPRADDDCRP